MRPGQARVACSATTALATGVRALPRSQPERPPTRAPNLTPIGQNIRLSQFTWDPQLNAPKRFCICGSGTFVGDYFGLDFGGGYAYTTSVSTYDYGQNPSNYQQQIVAKVALP